MPTGQSEGYDPALFAEIAELEDGSFWFTERDRLILWALRRYAPGVRSFLEVGCGTGHVLAAVAGGFPAAGCVGLEPFEEALAIARRKRPELDFRLGGADSLTPGEDFDAIGCFDVLEHIADDGTAAAAMAAALRPGGTLVVTVPQHRWLWSDADERAEHVRRYRRRELLALIEGSGLEIVRCTSFVTTLLPLLAASRLVRRFRPPEDPLRELRLSPAAQAILRPPLAFDRWLIARGASLPAGGSLLLVARRR